MEVVIAKDFPLSHKGDVVKLELENYISGFMFNESKDNKYLWVLTCSPNTLRKLRKNNWIKHI